MLGFVKQLRGSRLRDMFRPLPLRAIQKQRDVVEHVAPENADFLFDQQVLPSKQGPQKHQLRHDCRGSAPASIEPSNSYGPPGISTRPSVAIACRGSSVTSAPLSMSKGTSDTDEAVSGFRRVTRATAAGGSNCAES
jgi:hypothetical protein